MKTVLVTGGTGFIGNYVIEELLKRNFNVIATSLSEEKAKRFSWFSKVKYISFDLELFDDNKDYFNFFGSPDNIIHLAWEGLPNYKASFHVDVNLPRHFAFLKNLIRHGLNDITVTGTCFEYGMQEGSLAEDLPSLAANPYAVAKNNLRVLLEEIRKNNNFYFKWIRLFYMYGKGQNSNSLLSQLERAIDDGSEVFHMSGGEQLRDYLSVEEVASNIVTISSQNEIDGIINCCSGFPISIKELVKKYLAEKHANIFLNFGHYPYPDYEPMEFWGDNKKLNKILENHEFQG